MTTYGSSATGWVAPHAGHDPATSVTTHGDTSSSAASIRARSLADSASGSSPPTTQRRRSARSASAPSPTVPIAISSDPVGTRSSRGPASVSTVTNGNPGPASPTGGVEFDLDFEPGAALDARCRDPVMRHAQHSRRTVHEELAVGDAQIPRRLVSERLALDVADQPPEHPAHSVMERARAPRRVGDQQLEKTVGLAQPHPPPQLPVAQETAGQQHQVSTGSGTDVSRSQPSCWSVIDWMPTAFIV